MDKKQMEELVLSAKEGNKQSFSMLYQQIYKEIYCFALYTLKNQQEAEDAVSAAVIHAYEGICSLKKASAFRAWMYQIVLNECRAILRKRNTIIAEEQIPEACEVGIDLGEKAALWDCFRKLKDIEREVLSLNIFGGYNSREIAAMLHCSAGTVRSVKCRSLATLRTMLTTEGGVQ